MRKLIFAISTATIITVTGCGNESNSSVAVEKPPKSSGQELVPVNFNSLIGDPSVQELKEAEHCLSKFATKLEKDLKAGMASAGFKVDIFNIAAHKVFTDSQGNVNIQYSISGMNVLPNGTEQMMDNKKEIINCSSQSH